MWFVVSQCHINYKIHKQWAAKRTGFYLFIHFKIFDRIWSKLVRCWPRPLETGQVSTLLGCRRRYKYQITCKHTIILLLSFATLYRFIIHYIKSFALLHMLQRTIWCRTVLYWYCTVTDRCGLSLSAAVAVRVWSGSGRPTWRRVTCSCEASSCGPPAAAERTRKTSPLLRSTFQTSPPPKKRKKRTVRCWLRWGAAGVPRPTYRTQSSPR